MLCHLVGDRRIDALCGKAVTGVRVQKVWHLQKGRRSKTNQSAQTRLNDTRDWRNEAAAERRFMLVSYRSLLQNLMTEGRLLLLLLLLLLLEVSSTQEIKSHVRKRLCKTMLTCMSSVKIFIYLFT